MKKLIGVLFFAAVIWGCTKDDNPKDPEPSPTPVVSFQRGAMLENWADNIIIPSYEAFVADMATLKNDFEAFKVAANESNLVQLRASWLAAYKTWQQVSMFEIGPAETLGFRLNMNIYPTNAQKIEGYLSTESYNLSLSSNRDAKGFPALDYLLNGLEADDAATIARFNGVSGSAVFTYIEAVITDMVSLSEQVLSQWKEGYRDTFVANDGSSATSSVDRLVNDYIFYFEKFLRAGKMGIPLGVFSGSTLPENVEAYYQQEVSNELFLAGLQAVQDFFNGQHYNSSAVGESLGSYLDALNTVKEGEDLKDIINAQFTTAKTMVGTLDSFRSEIENNTPPTNMLLAYDEVQRLVPLLKVDMVSALSISIDFVDADGD